MWNGVSRRRFPRVIAPLHITIVKDGKKQAITTKTESVGQGGVSASFDRDLGRFSHVSLKLILPKTSKMIVCQGKIVWIIKKRTSRSGRINIKYDTGIEFLDLGRDDGALIEKVIYKLEIMQGEV